MLSSLLNTPVTLVVGVLALVVYWAWSKTRLKYEGSRIPPYPAPARPFLGHALWMKGDIMDTFSRMRKKAGDIFSLNLAGKHLIVVSGYENIREVLIKHADNASDRPVGLSSRILGEENHGLLTSRGPNWKEQRSTTVSILREFGMGKNLMAQKVAAEVQIYIEKLSSVQGQPLSLPVLTNAAVCNVICANIVGDRFDYDDEYFKRMIENLYAFVTKAPPFWVGYAASVVKRLPGDLFGIKDWEVSVNDLNENFSKFQIHRIKQEFDPSTEPQNFISAYLRVMHEKRESQTPTHLDEPNLISIIKSLFLAGTETTSTTITWCVLFCLHHPEVQEKVFNEIKSHVGTGRTPNTSDIHKLRYFSAVIRETQRLGSVAPLLPRLVTDNFELQGFLIPKDSQLMLDLTSALQDFDTWENPDKFCPERFLDATGNLTKPNELVPFGLGRRVCPGEALAKMELDLFLSAMFHRFRFEPEDPRLELPPLEGVMSLTLSPKPYKVRFVERV